MKPSSSYHHGNLYRELLERAEAQLKERGIAKLSLRALAREIGVSQTAPYRHFADKDALLAALATEGFVRFFDAYPNTDDMEPLESLVAMGRAYLNFAREHTEIFRLMFGPELLPRRNYPELFSAGREAFYRVHRLIKVTFAQHKLSEEEIASLAHTAWAAVHGVATLMLDHSESFGYYGDPQLQAERSLRQILAGIQGWQSQSQVAQDA